MPEFYECGLEYQQKKLYFVLGNSQLIIHQNCRSVPRLIPQSTWQVICCELPYLFPFFCRGYLFTALVTSALFSSLAVSVSVSMAVLLSISMTVTPAAAQKKADYVPGETVHASLETIVQTSIAVGTVKPKSETRIESQVRAQVEKVHVQAGERVQKGDLLITLDDRQAASRLDGARASLNAAIANKQQALLQGVTAAEAVHNETKLKYERIRGYYQSQAATKQELETAESAYVQAKAALKRSKEGLTVASSGIRQARQFVAEVKVGAGFSKIVAPSTGEVIRRMVEPGDMEKIKISKGFNRLLIGF